MILTAAVLSLIREPELPAEPQPQDPAQVPTAYAGGLLGGKHDFAQLSGQAGDACRACHVPHLQAVRPAGRDDGSVLELYRMDNQRRVFATNRYTPGPTSLICLSCHDGSLATSTIGAAHAILSEVRGGFLPPDGLAGRDHPIGVPYPSSNRDYRPAAFLEAQHVRLPDGRVECISCHDPHDSAGVDKMLVMSNRRSALCLACHVK